MLHMEYSSPSVITLVYGFTSLYKKIDFIQWHTAEDMIAFVFKSTLLVFSLELKLWLLFVEN